MKGLNYWQQLKKQHRRKVYKIIYIWKILKKQVPDSTPNLLKPWMGEHADHSCERWALKSTTPERIKNLLNSSFLHWGPRLFNMLPKYIRHTTLPSHQFQEKTGNVPADAGRWVSCARLHSLLLDNIKLSVGSDGRPQETLWPAAAVDHHSYEEDPLESRV